MSDINADLSYKPWDNPNSPAGQRTSLAASAAKAREEMAAEANVTKLRGEKPDVTPPLAQNPSVHAFMSGTVTLTPPVEDAANSDHDHSTEVLQELQSKVEVYCQQLREGAPEASAATNNPGFLSPLRNGITQMALQDFSPTSAVDDGDFPPNLPESGRAVVTMTRDMRASGKEPTRDDALGALDNTDKWVSDAAENGLITPECAADAHGRLGAAQSGTDAAGKQMTTSDIMGLIAEVLARTAVNSNEMRYQESKASLSGIEQSLEEAKQAAALKIEGAKEQRQASEALAEGEIASGAVDLMGGLGASIIGGYNGPVGQTMGQAAGGIGKIVDGAYKLKAAGYQYSATLHQAEADLMQSYSQQSGTMAQRAQSSSQDQGQAVQGALRALTDLINQLTQTTMGIAQNLGR
jgi:hypothetical protein